MFSSQNMLITGGTITQVNNNRHIHTSRGNTDRLAEAASPAAFHNSGDRRDPPKCHPNTRVAILEKIKDWILSLDPQTRNALIVWLHGPAGSGKSAIAQTIAEWAFEEGILLASYFFSRFDSSRNHPRSLIATIAYQVASHFADLKHHIIAVLDADPLIFTRSLITQIRTVIVEPLQYLTTSGYFDDPKAKRIVIIDGLDECEDRDGQRDILRTISKALQDYHLPLIFLIASRPEHDITYAFSSGHLSKTTFRIPLDDEYQSSSDIKLFLQDEFRDIKENHPLKTQISPEWPTEETLVKLVRKSSGQFIYAATVIKFVKSTRHRPVHRLEMVLGLRPAAGSRDMPFAELDALYLHVFSFVPDMAPVLRVLAFHILVSHSRCRFFLAAMEDILSLEPGDINLLLCDLHSIINVQLAGIKAIRFFHASLEDFLLDKSRSKELHIDPPIRHAEFAQILFPHPPFSRSAFALEVCGYHLERALPSERLRQEILDLDITGLVHAPGAKDVCLGVPNFLQSIQQSQFIGARELYFHHIRAFDKYGAQQLENYYSEKRLIALVAATAEHDIGYPPFPPNLVHELFLLDERLAFIDFHGLNLIQAMSPNSNVDDGAYLVFLQELLSDKTRLGIYAPDGMTYATGAIHFIRYICYHLLPKMSRYLLHTQTTRRNNPWKWRRKMDWKNHAYEKMFVNTRWWWWVNRNRIIWKKRPEACYYSMDFLAKLLPKAGRSEELINLARRCNFEMLSYVFPVVQGRRRVVKHEVARYLERMGRGDA